MNLTLARKIFTPRSAIGELSVDGDFECYTLEDPVREGPKIPGRTAIPEGRYAIAITWSARFHRELPLVVGVPGFSGVRIHAGNSPEDTEGCILVGRTQATDWIGESRVAFDRLYFKIADAIARGEEIWLEIKHQN
jgi:hypothetical protein